MRTLTALRMRCLTVMCLVMALPQAAAAAPITVTYSSDDSAFFLSLESVPGVTTNERYRFSGSDGLWAFKFTVLELDGGAFSPDILHAFGTARHRGFGGGHGFAFDLFLVSSSSDFALSDGDVKQVRHGGEFDLWVAKLLADDSPDGLTNYRMTLIGQHRINAEDDTPIPEPASCVLLVSAAVGALTVRRRRAGNLRLFRRSPAGTTERE